MNITFKTIKLHNFMSFTDAFITLNVPGYILVSGENNNTADNTSSNGSGKSSLWEAIIYALTGTTQRGIGSKSVLRQGSKEGYVELTLDIDGDEYIIKRGIE